ncbi:piggyBac transposable element-derived protein 3-like [Littorina saxatilis]|uniref:piggyBac transposable element-derived protein 3-like n=1 Tax=Littorina saxatilis TaxID=31220 RepID=UPI0038B42BD9
MTTSRRTFNVNQVVSILEDLGTFEEATVYIEPPAVGEDTDEDSGDEDDGGVVSNLNRNQLLAGSVATIVRQGVRSSVEDLAAELPADADHESSPSDTEPIDVNEPSTSSATPASSSRQCRGKRVQQTRTTTGPSKEKKTKIMKPKQQKQEREWKKSDISNRQKERFQWNSHPADASRLPDNPMDLFQIFFDEDVLEMIVEYSELYARSKGNDAFSTTPDEIRAFIGILLFTTDVLGNMYLNHLICFIKPA